VPMTATVAMSAGWHKGTGKKRARGRERGTSYIVGFSLHSTETRATIANNPTLSVNYGALCTASPGFTSRRLRVLYNRRASFYFFPRLAFPKFFFSNSLARNDMSPYNIKKM